MTDPVPVTAETFKFGGVWHDVGLETCTQGYCDGFVFYPFTHELSGCQGLMHANHSDPENSEAPRAEFPGETQCDVCGQAEVLGAPE